MTLINAFPPAVLALYLVVTVMLSPQFFFGEDILQNILVFGFSIFSTQLKTSPPTKFAKSVFSTRWVRSITTVHELSSRVGPGFEPGAAG